MHMNLSTTIIVPKMVSLPVKCTVQQLYKMATEKLVKPIQE